MREPALTVAIGRKGVGKTYSTLVMITDFRKHHPDRQVLILDSNNEYGNVRKDHDNKTFPDIKAIALSDVPKWNKRGKKEVRRVSIFKADGKPMSLDEIADALFYILGNFENGLLLIEDMTKFISDSLPNDLVGMIATQRHLSVDVITHFQTIGKVGNPKIWGNLDWLRFHRCEDTVERHKSKFAGGVEHLRIIEKMIEIKESEGDNRFYVYLDKGKGKIMGEFDKAYFTNVVERFLEDNKSIVKNEITREHLYTGKKVHANRRKAVEYLVQKYVNEYYGNEQ
jgi:hypothetical protein